MKAKTDNPLYDKKLQDILNKLISEEVIANQFYIGCIKAACKCQKTVIREMFIDIAVDELDDHAKNLIQWAEYNDYSVPYKFKDFEKYAAKTVVKQLDQLKDDQEAAYYVAEGLKSEEDAIASYKEAMEYEDVPQDLNAIFLQNYYDEIEHHENLATLKNAIDAGADLSNY